MKRNRMLSLVGALLALVLLAGCGGDDDDAADDTTTTTSTSSAGDTSATTREPISTPQILARLVVQVDDAFRRAQALARPCLTVPIESCTGEVREAYDDLDDLAGALRFALSSATNPENQMFSGRPADEIVGLMDESYAVSDDAKAKAEAAQAACLPEPTDACGGATTAQNDAFIELLKKFNTWRDFL